MSVKQKKKPTPTVLNRQYENGLEYQPKSNEKYIYSYIPILHCISRFEGASYKNLQDTATRSFISFGFY